MVDGEVLREPKTAGGVIERCFTGVLVLRLTGEGEAVLETTGENSCAVVATLCAFQEGVEGP